MYKPFTFYDPALIGQAAETKYIWWSGSNVASGTNAFFKLDRETGLSITVNGLPRDWASTGGTSRYLVEDSNGNYFTTGAAAFDATGDNQNVVRKYNSAGTLLWSYALRNSSGQLVNGRIVSLVINPSNGEVIIGGQWIHNAASSPQTQGGVRRLTSAGAATGTVFVNITDPIVRRRTDGNIVIAGSGSGTTRLQVLSSTLGAVNSVNPGADPNSLDLYYTDSSVYVTGSFGSNVVFRRYNSSLGSNNLNITLASWFTTNVAVNQNDGGFVLVGTRLSNITTRYYNSSGTQQWTADHGNTLTSATIDEDGNVYTSGSNVSDVTTRKYSPSGTLLWSTGPGGTPAARALESRVLQL
jgi:hypothetical protein